MPCMETEPTGQANDEQQGAGLYQSMNISPLLKPFHRLLISLYPIPFDAFHHYSFVSKISAHPSHNCGKRLSSLSHLEHEYILHQMILVLP